MLCDFVSELKMCTCSQNALRAVIDQFQKFIRAMKVLEQPTGQWDAVMFLLLYRKMPGEAIGFVNRSMRGDAISSVTEILRVIGDYSETVSALDEQSSVSGSCARGKRLAQMSYVARAAARSSMCSGGHHKLLCFNRGGDQEQVQAGMTKPQVLPRA